MRALAFAENRSGSPAAPACAKAFLKTDGEPYDAGKTFKKALVDRLPDLAERYLSGGRGDPRNLATGWRSFRMLENTRSALTIADSGRSPAMSS